MGAYIQYVIYTNSSRSNDWLVVLRIYVALAVFSAIATWKQEITNPGIEPWAFCSASQELNHYTTAAPSRTNEKFGSKSLYVMNLFINVVF